MVNTTDKFILFRPSGSMHHLPLPKKSQRPLYWPRGATTLSRGGLSFCVFNKQIQYNKIIRDYAEKQSTEVDSDFEFVNDEAKYGNEYAR